MAHFNGLEARAKRLLMLSSSAAALCALTAPGLAHAQAADPAPAAQEPEEEEQGQELVVTGFRSSLDRGSAIKREATQMVDAISAEELGKLPDQNIAESLQRVTGVQIQRSGGEGNKFQIRGSNYNLTLVNGREVAPDPAFGGAVTTPNRQVNLFNYPSVLFSEVLVYKSPTASQIEGGVGGTVDLRMPDPLKTPSRTIVSADIGYLSLSRKPGYEAVALTSQRFGNFGFLLGATYFRRESATDNHSGSSTFVTNAIDVNGDGTADPGLVLPFNMTYSRQNDTRIRTTVNALVSWEPTPTLGLRLEGTFIRQDTDNRRAFISFTTTNARNVAGSPLKTQTEADGSTTFLSGQLRNVLNAQDGLGHDERRSLFQGSFGLKWTPSERLTISTELAGSKTKAEGFLIVYQGVQNSITVDVDMQTEVPSVSLVSGGAFTNLPSYNAYVLGVRNNLQEPDLVQSRFDIAYEPDGFVRKLSAGVRGTRANFDTVSNQTRYQTNFPIGASYPLSMFPEYIEIARPKNFFNGAGGNYPTEFLIPYAEPNAANGSALLAKAGYVGPLQPLATSSYDIGEKTFAGYVQLDWGTDLGSLPISGNIGVRYVKTRIHSASTALTAAGTPVPIAFDNEYEDVLPSANIKADLSQNFVVRASASKVMSRPPIDSLSAGTTITFSSGLNSAASGQPLLDPFRADQFDVSAEYYLPDGIISGAFFYKDIKSFITTSSTVGATLPGLPGTYFLTAPANGPGGVSKGFEIGVQRSFGFISDSLKDFGVVLNYTYVDSKRANSNLPIEFTSKHSYNVVGFYESGPFQARLAYNWRSEQYMGVNRAVNIFANPRGQLDFSMSYDIFENVTLSLEGIDLFETPQTTYALFPDRPDGYQINDRRIFFGVRTRF